MTDSGDYKKMGEERFERLVRIRPSKPLVDGDHLLFHHALRCLCAGCGKLLNWECPKDDSATETECCGMRYRLLPWTVKVEVEDISSRPILPPMAGSNYADPDFDLKSNMSN